MTSPQMCLRWNNHHPNFISIFKNLLEDEELVDVTISVDGQKIKAHKVILSACSPYFKAMFSSNPCKHPVVILSDIKFTDLKTIIEFMYYGEIVITDEQLPDILEVAEALQVRGLFDPNKKFQGSATMKKKNEASLGSELTRMDVTDQKVEDNCDEKITSPKAGPSFEAWMSDQGNENEFNSSYLSPVQGSILTPNVCYFGESSRTLQSSHFVDMPSAPSPHPSPGRRRNTKVQQSENFHLALEAVRTGQLGFCKAAKLYGLNNRTLWLEYKKRGYPSKRSQPVALKLKQAENSGS